MSQTLTTQITSRVTQTAMLATALMILVLLLLRGILSPDSGADFYLKAKNLEQRGLLQLALSHYALISDKHPESSYAPVALERQGDIRAGMGRKAGNIAWLREAVATYRRLAETYPSNLLAGKALLAAGEIATTDLRDIAVAKQSYQDVLQRFPNNAGYTAEATLRLGRLAITERDGKSAQAHLQRVLQRHASFVETCAEAQYYLGVAYETLFTNKEHVTWAKNAYEATFKRYPQSVWATNAQERLGMIAYLEMKNHRPARRVLIAVTPLPDEGFSGDSDPLLAALRLLLAARGIEVSETVLDGWSLQPFYTGFAPDNPSRVVEAPFDRFQNVIASAGLIYTIKRGGTAAGALRDLQDELDMAHPPVIYNGRWALAIGYDSERNEVQLQSRGARYEVVPVKDLAANWKKTAPLPRGGSFTLVTFYTPKDRPAPKKNPGPLVIGQPQPTAVPTATPLGQPSRAGGATVLSPLTTPTYIYDLPPLSVSEAHRRAIRRAADLLRHPRDGKTLLNLEALRALAHELERVSIRPAHIPSPVPVPEGDTDDDPYSDRPLRAGASPTVIPGGNVAAANALPRARALLGWFKTPLQRWVNARRDAAAYLDTAAGPVNPAVLRRAADDFREASATLQRAEDALPLASALSDDGKTLSEPARVALESAGREVQAAYESEKRAADAMSSIK